MAREHEIDRQDSQDCEGEPGWQGLAAGSAQVQSVFIAQTLSSLPPAITVMQLVYKK